MNKPSVDAQLAFMRKEFDNYFYQVYNTDSNQIFGLKRTGVLSILSIVFLDPENKINDWISSTKESLEFFVDEINKFFNDKASNLRIVTFYRDTFRPDLEIDGFKFAQFVIGFEKVVSDRDFELIWEGLKETIKKYNQTLNLVVTQPDGFKLFIEKTKKEIEQLIFLRSLQSPLDFEENIKLNQLLASKQEQLDKEIFGQNEIFMSQDNIFDDLFEQSFTPIQNSYNNIFAKDENGSDFFTPNGERSSLNDAENALIRSSLFVEWFGDWQLAYQYKEAGIKDFACSKVLSPKFEPQVVWHGTGDEFSYFRFDNFPAAYFAVNKAYSQWFADLHAREGEGYTIPFFLSVNNPLDLTLFETRKIDPKTFFDYIFLQTGLTKDELDINPIFADSNLGQLETWMYLRNNPKMLKKLADSKLFDGIHFYETNPSIDESEPFYKTEAWIIFSPHQAKLADPSRGLLLFSSLKSFLLEKGGKI
jgi:hypothetical protein